jgi:RNA polymerase sigma factor (sigma-70 family)
MTSRAATMSQVAGGFERTQWSDVLKAARQSTDATQAFERMANAYRQPLYQFICRRGHQPADAEDLVQGFFQFLMEKRPLAVVDPVRGRFRAFLLGVLRHYLANQQASQNAQKRGGGRATESIDNVSLEAQAAAGLVIDCSADEVFDADWAEKLVGRALAQLKAEYEIAGRLQVFERLNPYLSTAGGQPPYAAVAPELNTSEAAVKMAVNRIRRRFRALLRSCIAETVSRQEDVADEYRYLLRVITRKRE